jgi:hypothetical protein
MLGKANLKFTPSKEEHMNRFRNALLATAAALLIVQALLFTGPGQALAQDVASVLIANTAANPVPVRDVDNGQQPVIVQGAFGIGTGQFNGSGSLLTVPAGKRLVIETVSIFFGIPQGQFLEQLALGAGFHSFQLTPPRKGTSTGTDYYGGTFAFRTYFDPGAKVTVSAVRSANSGSTIINVTMSGYYINVP